MVLDGGSSTDSMLFCDTMIRKYYDTYTYKYIQPFHNTTDASYVFHLCEVLKL